ncbi:MAG TPA: hypothetical protein VE982_04470 [Gaiellaceae bacterium]|nr:hypothetical protein [Gaiellaceae bacterium]
MEHLQRTLNDFLGPGWVEVEPGIYRPPTLVAVDGDARDGESVRELEPAAVPGT